MRTPIATMRLLTVLAGLGAARGLLAEPLSPGYAWGENLGWIRLRVGGEPPPQVEGDFLSGFIRADSVGWIHLGDGSPADGIRYANDSAGDYGVNRDGFDLSGWAWGEIIGWIRFDPAEAPIRVTPDGRIMGAAWAESMGWIIFLLSPLPAGDDAAVTEEGKAVEVHVLLNDRDFDGDPLAVQSVTEPAHGTAAASADSGHVVYAPEPGYRGPDSFTYTAGDGAGDTYTAAVAVTVTGPRTIVGWGDAVGIDPDSGLAAVSGGWHHVLGLKVDGSVVAWGLDDDGECDVPAPNDGFVAVSAGESHSLGLKDDGSIVAWGDDTFGQCDVPSPDTGFVAVAAGLGHSLGLKADGSVVGWGRNDHGECDPPPPNAGFVGVSAGDGYSLGLKADGSVVAWGDPGVGQCGVPLPNADFVAVDAGDAHCLGLKADGSVVAWGDNGHGECDVPSPNAGFVAVSAGASHSLGLKADGTIVAWGLDIKGQCDVPSPNAGFVAVSAGQGFSHAVQVVPALQPGVAQPVTLTSARAAALFEVSSPPGRVLAVDFTDAEPLDANALYFRWGSMPKPYLFDAAAEERDQACQHMVVPSTRGGYSYIRVQANVLAGGNTQGTIVADFIDMALDRIWPSTGASGVLLSAAITGSGFTGGTAFRLASRADPGKTIAASSMLLVSTSRAEATFDLAGAAAGAYDLEADAGPGLTARRESAFEVLPAGKGPVLQVGLAGPARCRWERASRVTLTYENAGDGETASPLIEVVAPPDFTDGPIQVLGIDPSGVPGMLGPGGKGEVPIVFRGRQAGEARFEVLLFSPTTRDYVGWDALPPPAGMGAEEWSALWPGLSTKLGDTWIEYNAALAEIAGRLARRHGDATSARECFRFAAREALGRPASAVVGVVRDSTGAPVEGKAVMALLGGSVVSSATTRIGGFYALDWLEGGRTYVLRVEGLDIGAIAAAPPAGGDLLGFDLVATGEATTPAPACPNRDEAGLPERPLEPPANLFAPVAGFTTTVVQSWDPNDKEGPEDGLDGALDGTTEIRYEIRFENRPPEATAPALVVVIEDDLSPDFDWTSFRAREVGVGTKIRSLDIQGSGEGWEGLIAFDPIQEPGSAVSGYSRTTRIEGVGEGGAWSVHVLCEASPSTGKVRWTFRTVDPATGLAPPEEDPDAGFLPVNDAAHAPEGEGLVAFTVKPKESLADEVELVNDALIAFDNNPPVTPRPTWRNVIRRSAPLEPPYGPGPGNGMMADTDVVLTWSSSGETFDLFLWKSTEPEPDPETTAPTAANMTEASYAPAGLEHGTVYLWKVVSRRGAASATGPAWTFTTVAAPPALPAEPGSPMPASGSVDIPRRPLLDWAPAARAEAYAVYLWKTGLPKPPEPLARGLAGDRYQVTSDLDSFTDYKWQIEASNPTGKQDGAIWTFRTVRQTPRFLRGDANADGGMDLADALFILFYSFLGEGEPKCMKALDANGSGTRDLADAVTILEALFLDGPTPPEPYAACGTETVETSLTCLSYPPCGE